MWHIVREYLAQERRARLTPEALRAYRDRRLREIVRLAWDRVPWYRRLFEEAGLRPENVRGLADLPRIPATDKRLYREAPIEDRVARGMDLSSCRRASTSGSTGIPIDVFMDRAFHAQRVVLVARLKFAFGLLPWHRQLHMGYTRAKAISWYLRPWVRQCDLEEAPELIRRFAPRQISGYPSQLALLAQELARRRQATPSIRLVFAVGEPMEPSLREHLATTFNDARLVDIFGAHEFGFLAEPCPLGGCHHLAYPDVVIESVRDGRAAPPGEAGEIVITSLRSMAMPFIRYRLNDWIVVKPGPCACGFRGEILSEVIGRRDDYVHLPDGRPVSGWMADWTVALPPALREGVLQFRVVEEALGHIRVLVVLRGALADELRAWICDFFRSRIQASRVEVEPVSSLPPDPGGKSRRVVSRVRL